MVWIVRAANCVEIELLEKRDITQHALLSDGLSSSLIMLVPTHPFDQDRTIVVQKIVILDLIPLEADLHKKPLGKSAKEQTSPSGSPQPDKRRRVLSQT